MSAGKVKRNGSYTDALKNDFLDIDLRLPSLRVGLRLARLLPAAAMLFPPVEEFDIAMGVRHTKQDFRSG